ncbi:cation:proton antiporter [Gallionella capsiferriformans]|jgi:CPA2 family monovalent cation:H+ antiporter-2|uniref:Potassium efflux system protein n=1 Tax=Gallionella capsiferriformans (strain ES-2) TaxID=395494 RepID=D9SJ43_GALCS|nr:monovalent cation:proton antiporter-2 (CPA2) family protein [Gallionella capsiferriformans]ADL54319.1 potassium efflux system protein [Gallionella capsiferriformans ES-2]
MDNSLSLVLILLATAVMVVVVCRILRLPVMLGYLAVGILIGPHAFGWIPDSPSTRHLGEFGVVFLMFSIGLEFSLTRLKAMHRTVFGLGGAQVLSTILLVMAAATLLGVDWRAGLALGGILAMSSTAIVSKMLVERAELNLPYGQQMMGVLLFQDLAVVPLLIIIPALASQPDNLHLTLGLAMFKATIVLLILLVFGQHVMRRWFHIVASQKSSELFTLNVLFITLGLAYLTELAGLSMALGAFVAGMLISETEYRYQVEEDIKPFRDVLLGLFFVTIGMMLNPASIVSNLGWIALALPLLILFKALLVAILARIFEGEWSVALRSGIGLAQAGEFGFVLLTLTDGAHLLQGETMQITLATMLLSMVTAPFLIQYGEAISRRFSDEWTNRALQMHQIAIKSMSSTGHVILCGYGRSGQKLASILEDEELRFIALDLDSRRVREAAAGNKSVVYGDAAKREVLMAAGLMRARVLVVTYKDKHSTLAILRHVKELRPDLPVVVRTNDDTNLELLKNAGAAEVVAEVLEGSVMLASQALLLAGVPLNRVIRHVQENRARRYAMFNGYINNSQNSGIEISDDMQPRFLNVMLKADSFAVGKRLRDSELDTLNVEVKALRRYNVHGAQPSEDMVLRSEDVLVLLGLPEALLDAEIRLHKGGL